MKIIVTCGPSYEPIDQVRRLTNFSTGELGVTLANHLSNIGHEVICLKGEGSTFSGEVHTARLERFATNCDLTSRLKEISAQERIDVIFHAAALCDYRVERVLNGAGDAISSRKFATREGGLHLVLAPATKVLPQLRGWFPQSQIVGWKYEVTGSLEDAFTKVWDQVRECRTDACVLNGAAYGEGFAICQADRSVKHCAGLTNLCERLSALISSGDAARRRLKENCQCPAAAI